MPSPPRHYSKACTAVLTYWVPKGKQTFAFGAGIGFHDMQSLLRTDEGHKLPKMKLWVGQRRRAAHKLQPRISIKCAYPQKPAGRPKKKKATMRSRKGLQAQDYISVFTWSCYRRRTQATWLPKAPR
jgi:hypothetical protein